MAHTHSDIEAQWTLVHRLLTRILAVQASLDTEIENLAAMKQILGEQLRLLQISQQQAAKRTRSKPKKAK